MSTSFPVLSTRQAAPSVIRDCITVLVGPPGEFNEEVSPDAEDNDEDEVEEEYELRF